VLEVPLVLFVGNFGRGPVRVDLAGVEFNPAVGGEGGEDVGGVVPGFPPPVEFQDPEPPEVPEGEGVRV
jgi:hypothetical protein